MTFMVEDSKILRRGFRPIPSEEIDKWDVLSVQYVPGQGDNAWKLKARHVSTGRVYEFRRNYYTAPNSISRISEWRAEQVE